MKAIYQAIIGGWLLCGGVAGAQVPPGADWHLEKEGHGIQVYTAPAKASGLKYIKANAKLNGTLDRVGQVFRDIAGQKDWVYATRRAYLVRKTDDNHLVYYNETALPWPASNRDVAIQMTLEADPSARTLVITQNDAPGAVPANKGIVRVPHLSGYWKFRETAKGQLQAEYYLDINPGGSLPAWVVNMFASKGPYETFLRLQKQISQ